MTNKYTFSKIQKVVAREVLDSRGFPTVEAEVHVGDNRFNGHTCIGRGLAPSGASTGEGEALELRDGDKSRFLGKGVLKAVQNIQNLIAPQVISKEFRSQKDFDQFLIQLDGTENKSKLGANAILAVSMAFARAQSMANGVNLYEYLRVLFSESSGTTIPVPLMNIINGGKHADNGLALQEFMIVPAGFKSFREALRAGAEVFHQLKKILHDKGLSTSVGDEGGFAPVFEGEKPHEQALESIMKAVTNAGYKAGEQVFLALDAAASEFGGKDGKYQFEGKTLSSDEMIGVYEAWIKKFPIVSIEDGLGEHDWTGWKKFTQSTGARCQLVGDDLFVTNIKFLQKGIDQKVCNSILIKLNQIGTVTETVQTMLLAQKNGYSSIVSHRSGETEDTFIADLAVASDCGQIKTGSASRTDRIAKYNQLLRLEDELSNRAEFKGVATFESRRKTI